MNKNVINIDKFQIMDNASQANLWLTILYDATTLNGRILQFQMVIIVFILERNKKKVECFYVLHL